MRRFLLFFEAILWNRRWKSLRAESLKEGVCGGVQFHLHLGAIGQGRFLLQFNRAPAYDTT